MNQNNRGEAPKGSVITGDAVVVRLERDGFGMIQDTRTQRFGVFTTQTTKLDPKKVRNRYRAQLRNLFGRRRLQSQLRGEGKMQAKALALAEAKAGLKEGASVHFVAEDKGELLNVTELHLS
jgi:hypothetical protein